MVTAPTTCLQCNQPFVVTAEDHTFYSKMKVPAPSRCPSCRMQRRLAYRNDRSLYRSECALTKKSMITMYDPAQGFTVYEYKSWWSEAWDPLLYGRGYEASNSFFDQFRELQKVVPRFNLFNRDSENCDYVNYAPHCKNGYLLFGSWFCQDCFYGQSINESRDCVDSLFLDRSELCYENIDCAENYNSYFCQNSSTAVDSYFCYDCHNVKYCIGCFNLRNKEYYIHNKPVSKEEYERVQHNFSSYSFLSSFQEHYRQTRKATAIHKAITGLNNERVSGDFIFNCKNAKYCFSTYRSEDIAYCSRSFEQKDSYDYEGGGKGELVYESMSNDLAYYSLVCTTCENLRESHYCDLCFNCKHCFGCVGLRGAEYCVLNRQYSSEEYQSLVARITSDMTKRGEWGEFFPVSHSPFAYNETMAGEYFPLAKEEVLRRGWRWKGDQSAPGVASFVVPDILENVPDTIVRETLACGSCSKSYKIIVPELAFYRKAGLPIPRICPDCRHRARMAQRNPRRIWSRNCAECKRQIDTSFNPEGPEKVFCEDCYGRLVL